MIVINGHVYKATGEPVPGAKVWLADDQFNSLFVGTTTNSLGAFTFRADENLYAYYLVVEPPAKAGLRSVVLPTEKLDSDTHVILPIDVVVHTTAGKKKFPLWLALLPLVAIAGKKNQVGKFEAKDVLPYALIGAGVLGFDLIKELLVTLGIWDSKAHKELEAQQQSSVSPWSPNFYKTAPGGALLLYSSQAADYAKKIYNAFGPFNDDEEIPIGLVKANIRTQSQFSFLCDAFQKKYGQDLLKFLIGGIWPQDRLSEEDVAEINRYVLTLPKYTA
jgi:hypothetical protein